MDTFVLNDKLFHGVKSNLCLFNALDYDSESLEIIKLKFENIFATGFVMCRNSLINTNSPVKEFSRKDFNGESYVSLCRHISHQNIDNRCPGYIINEEENAFVDYPFNYPSIVFDQSLFKTNEQVKNSVRILLELQVMDDIPLKRAVAISLPGREAIEPFFKTDCNLISALEHFERRKTDYLILKHLLYIIKLYNYNLPIVNIDTGAYYHDNQEYEKEILKLM